MSFRLRVLQALCDVLKGVEFSVGAQTYSLADYTDATGRTAEKVFRGRTKYGYNDPLPMLSVLEDFKSAPVNLGSAGNTQGILPFPLLIQGFIKDDADHPTDPAYPFAAATIKALLAERVDQFNILGLGGNCPCVTDIQISTPVIRPPDGETSDVAFFYLTVTLTLAEDFESL